MSQTEITFQDSPLIIKSTASTPSLGVIAKPASYPPAYPSTKIQIETSHRPNG